MMLQNILKCIAYKMANWMASGFQKIGSCAIIFFHYFYEWTKYVYPASMKSPMITHIVLLLWLQPPIMLATHSVASEITGTISVVMDCP